MSNQRRRAHNFTDSINSFRQTISKDESSQIPGEFDKYSCSENTSCVGSVILAGSSTNQQFISCSIAEESYNMAYKNIHPLLKDDTLIVSDETSYLSVKPDLNKCINLFNNEYLNNEYDGVKKQLNLVLTPETNINQDIDFRNLNKSMRQQDLNTRSMSAESLRSIILNRELKRSKSYTVLEKALKRDRNYNIKSDQLFFRTKNAVKRTSHKEIETVIPSFEALSLSKHSALNRKDDSPKENQYDSVNSEMSSKDELSPFELKTMLQSLTDQKPLKEMAAQRFLRRLSINYYNSPKDFTESLLTIIEESVINNDSRAQSQHPELSLFRFNEELRKMCKFLEDETAPEWPESPGMSTPICTKRKSQEPNNLLRKSLVLSPDKDLCFTTPVSSQCNIKSPKKMSKNLLDDTNTFESLEAMCKQLFPDDASSIVSRMEKNLSPIPQNMANILRICKNQMASLENSPNVHKQIKKAGMCTSDSAYQHSELPEAQNLEYRLLLNEKYDRMDSEGVLDILKQQTEHGKRQEMMESNDFESTVMYEIAKKRQRCLDTAKIVMEIDENFKPMEEIYPNINDSSSIEVDDKLMTTLMSVKKYQDYLEKCKSLLNLFHRTSLSSTPRTPCDRQDVQDEETSNNDFNTCTLSIVVEDKQTLQIPSPRKKSVSPSSTKCCSTNKTVVSKPRLFITPGKTLVNKNCKPKRTYFPNLLPGTNKQNKHVSPQVKNIYRQIGNYDHVVSPVAMYIKGTESHLTKNLKPKTDKMLPKRKLTTQSPNSKMKLQSSPKEKLTGTTVGDKNVADNFLHPKMHYNYPSHSRVIEKTVNLKVGHCETE